MKRTTIEWTDVAWNPIRGCSPVSAGCTNCFAMRQAHRFSGPTQPYAGLTELGPQGPRWTGMIALDHDALKRPLHWRKPKRIFVNSMSDLFHEEVPFEFVHRVFATIRQTPQHIYQVLTKRPERMREFITDYLRPREALGWANGFYRHVHFGVSIEDQATADVRIPILLQTPAAVRWVSAEPLLGPVDLGQIVNPGLAEGQDFIHALAGYAWTCSGSDYIDTCGIGAHLDWVVVGGESGPRARRCDLAWIRSLRDQCQTAAVPIFIKQLGRKPYLEEGSPAAREWYASGATAIMDDCGGIHTKDRKGNTMAEWPDDLRIRVFPNTPTSLTALP